MKKNNVADLAEWIIQNPKDYCYEELLDYAVRFIKVYAKQEVLKRDEQWLDTLINLGYLTDTDLIDEVNKKLPKLEFE